MKFLDHNAIKKKVVSLLSCEGPIRIAVAYWGSGALKLLNLDPRRADLQILCCLKSGTSDPAIIRQFAKGARQIDNLHAKVFWTNNGAIVGSANASANGLPEQEKIAGSLIEAGVYLDDKDEVARIRYWFDNLYENAKVITEADLKKAAQDRAARLGKNVPKRPFLAALQSNPSEFSQQRISFYLYKEFWDEVEKKAVMKDAREHPEAMNKAYGDFPEEFDFYTFYRKPSRDYFPAGSILIEGLYTNGKISKNHFYIRKTFHDVSLRKTTGHGQTMWWMPVLQRKRDIQTFNYDLTAEDKAVISKASKALWDAGRKGVQDDSLISLTEARPILLNYMPQV
jgi:hypothetical protein